MPTPVLDAFSDVLSKRYPVIGGVLGAIGPELVEEIRRQPASTAPKAVVEAIAPRLEKVAAGNAVMVNNAGAEKPLQSRTTLAMGGALLTSLAMLIETVRQRNFDFQLIGSQLASILLNGYGLYGRWWPGLKPLFWRRG